MIRRNHIILTITSIVGPVLLFFCLVCCSEPVNTENNPNFDEDGYAVYNQQDSVLFTPTEPAKVKFYFEVSGSMSGFFCSNAPTGFKEDVNDVLNKYPAISEIYVMKDLKGERPDLIKEDDFVKSMNSGAFGDTLGSTLVPYMIENIMARLDVDNGEVAVFISDMIYDPAEDKTAKVLATQYGSNIAKILHQYGKSVCLVCATSSYIRKTGTVRAPYYYLIMGNGPQVAKVCNDISGVLEKRDRFVDNIVAGFDYGRPTYTFGAPQRCSRMNKKEPTFIEYEDEEDGDTCTIKLNINLENYRKIITDEEYFKTAFYAQSTYGTSVKYSNIEMDKKNMTAIVKLKVYGMVLDSEVLEWGLKLPNTDYTLMSEFLEGATDPNDPTKSYSVKDFCEGMFGGLTNEIKPNYILISKKN